MSRWPGVARLGLSLGLGLLILAAAGCATGGATATSPTEVEQLKDRVVDLQRKAAMNEVEIARLTQRIAELEASSPAGPAGRPVRTVTPPPAVVEAPEPVVSSPPPPVNPRPPVKSAPATRPLASRPALEVTDIDLPPASPPPTPKPAPPKSTATPAPSRPAGRPAEKLAETPRPTAPAPPAARPAPAPATGGGGETEPPMAAQALYDRGYTLYHQGRYADAEASFERFLKADPKSELADNAQYWIGECRFGRNDLRGALTAFRDTVERFPQGNKVPDALLKAAQTLETLGETDKARATYNEVIQKFPTTAAAAVAEERKAKLR